MKIRILFIAATTLLLVSCKSSLHTGSSGQPLVVKASLTEAQQLDFKQHLYAGLRLKEDGYYQQALDSLQHCYTIDSLDAGLLAEIALMQAYTEQKEASLLSMQQALKLDPDNWWFNMQMIRMYMHSEKTAEALLLAEQLQKKFPLREDVYNLLIPMYQQGERYEDALAMYDQLEKIIGINERVSFDKMGLNLMLNRPKKAASEIDKLIQKYPFENRYKVLKGDFMMQLRQPDKALEIYQQVLAEDPQNPFAQISFSEYYNATGKPEKSLEYVILALKNNQLELETKLQILGQHIENLLKADSQLEETESLFKLLIEHYPLEEKVHEYYAAYLQHQKREKDALSVYESILAINPAKESVWFGMMQIYYNEKQYEKVIDVADRAIAALENDLRAYYFKAITYDIWGMPEKALATHQAALSLFGDNELPQLRSDVYAHMAEIYNQQKKKEQAYEAYDNALKYNPDNVMVLNNYAYNLSVDKVNLSKAERMSAKTIEKEPRNSTYLDTYAWIFYQQGNYALARFYMERAISYLSTDNNAGIYFEHLGDILWMMGSNDEKALENWKKAWEAGIRTDELKQKIDNKGWKRD